VTGPADMTAIPPGTAETGPGVQRLEHVMGMPVGIDVREADVQAGDLDSAFGWLRFVDALFSTYRGDSEISRLNRGELSLADAHPDVREVLDRCQRLCEDTGGYFDATAPAAAGRGRGVDPSGLVKGWSIDRMARILEAAGAGNYCVYAGGDILVRGRPGPGQAWRIGIQHPHLRHHVAAVLEVTDLAVATSGAYARGDHVVDPHTGRPPQGVLSVTVAGPDLAEADAYATAAFAMGEEGPFWTSQLAGYAAMTIVGDDTVLTTRGFDRYRVS